MNEMQAYMLSKLNGRGEEIWQGTFDSEDALLAAIPERPRLSIKGGAIVAELGSADLSNYRVKTITMNELRTDSGEVDLPDITVTVNSETDSKLTYGVAIRNGEIVACSCPAFQYGKDGGACKHMSRVRWNPTLFGLYSAVNGYKLLDQPPLKTTLPGSYYARYGD